MKGYDERKHETDYEDAVDADTGEKIDRAPLPSTTRSLILWAEERMGKKFANVGKQSRHIVLMRKAGYSDNDIIACWENLERDEFWREKGIDFGIVGNQIAKAVKKPIFKKL